MRAVCWGVAGMLLVSGCAAGPASRWGADDPRRPASDVARDAARRPAAILDFAQVRPGQRVAEYMPGAGYFTRLFAVAVGPKGEVLAYQPAEIVRLVPKYLTEIRAAAAAYPNISVASAPTANFAAPWPADLVFTAQNYHDLHTRFAPPGAAAAFNAAVFRTLRSGGSYVVIDHAAAAGSDLTVADRLHRIDPQAVKAEVLAVGFVLEAQSDALANPADPMTGSVFAPEIQGKTAQFALRFRKP